MINYAASYFCSRLPDWRHRVRKCAEHRHWPS